MYKPITFEETVRAGDKLQFQFAFYDAVVRPTSDSLIQAIEAVPDFNVSAAEYNFISGNIIGSSGTITGTVANTGGNSNGVTTPQAIAADIREVLSGFASVYGVNISAVSKDNSTLGSLFGSIVGVDPTTAPSASTTISLAAIAVMVLVVGLIIFKME